MSDKSFLISAFEPCYGKCVQLSSLVRRVTSRNPGAFARWGTNTYLVGTTDIFLIDPGPELEDHWEALLAAIGPGRVTHIGVSHLHPDHSPLASRLADRFGAEIIIGDSARAGPDQRHPVLLPARGVLAREGREIEGVDWRIRLMPTPGHTRGHLSFELLDDNTFFSGDHVMAWATPAIQPPEGDLREYLDSLHATIEAGYSRLYPGHGPTVDDPDSFLQACLRHRRDRDDQILAIIDAGPAVVSDIVARLYVGLQPNLCAAAAGTITAHLMRLERIGILHATGGRWRIARRFKMAG